MLRINLLEKQCTRCLKVKPAREFFSPLYAEMTRRCKNCRSQNQRAHYKYVNKDHAKKRKYETAYAARKLNEATAPTEKRCTRCLKVKPIAEFGVTFEGAPTKLCNACLEWGRRNIVAYRSRWTPEQRQRNLETACARQREYRRLVLEHYGKKCACCGDEHVEFLGIDHINGEGGQHRREIAPTGLYRWLINHKFPPQFRTLCLNCNFSLGVHGYCPHQRETQT